MAKTGICPECNRGPRDVSYVHPLTLENICRTCHIKATGSKSQRKKGFCSNCGQGPKEITYRDIKTKQPICSNCYHKTVKNGRVSKPTIPSAVQLPKENSLTRYPPGSSVVNQNLTDPKICGKVGMVETNNDKEVVVNFGEIGEDKTKIRRIYPIESTLIAPYTYQLMRELKKAQRSIGASQINEGPFLLCDIYTNPLNFYRGNGTDDGRRGGVCW